MENNREEMGNNQEEMENNQEEMESNQIKSGAIPRDLMICIAIMIALGLFFAISTRGF